MSTIDPAYWAEGTVSVAAAGTVVTGVGTGWTTADIRAMDTIQIADRQCLIRAVVSDTQITLLLPWSGAPQAGVPYAVLRSAPERLQGPSVAAQITELVAQARLIRAGVTTWSCLEVGRNAPPAAPVRDDTYIVGTAPSGAWAGAAGQIAQWSGTGWRFTVPTPGMRAYSVATGDEYVRGATTWTLSGVDSRQPLDATLSALATLAAAGGDMIYATGPDAFGLAPTSAFGRSLLAPADAESAQILLGLSRVRSQFTTIADDASLQIPLTAGTIGWGVIVPQFSSAPAAVFHFRSTAAAWPVGADAVELFTAGRDQSV